MIIEGCQGKPRTPTIIEKVCPNCGSENIDVIQRITGYLVSTTDRWNQGKVAELHDRVIHC